jgi:hypothetical protein
MGVSGEEIRGIHNSEKPWGDGIGRDIGESV